MKKLALIFSVTALTLLGFSCAKKDNNNPISYQLNQMGQCVDQNGSIVNQTYCTNGYQFNAQGICVQVSTGQQAPAQYCQQNGMNGYQLNQYGQCVQTTTGQIVATQLCQQNNNGLYQYNMQGICIYTPTGQQAPAQYCQQQSGYGCVGQYWNPMNGGYYINCTTTAYGNSCRGMQLISVSTGQTVYCQ